MIYGTLPCAEITCLNPDASMVTVLISDTLKLVHPSSKSKKSARKGSVAVLKENIQWVVCPKNSPQKKVYSAGNWKIVLESHSQVLKDHDASRKNSANRGSIAGIYAKMCTSGPNSVGSKIRGKNARRNPETGAMRPQRRKGPWPRMSINSEGRTDTFCSPAEAWVMPAPSSKNPGEREYVIDFGASMHTLSKKDPSSGELERSRKP